MRRNPHDLTPTGYVKRPMIVQGCTRVKNAWGSVKTDIIVKSFKKCQISNVLDGTEANILFEDSSNDNPDKNCCIFKIMTEVKAQR